jgi:pimeloyl-ACP methyl ester carboxylesterase
MKRPKNPTQTVILLHGLGRSGRSFALMAGALRGAGFGVVNVSYPSTRAPIEKLVAHLDAALAKCADAQLVHFVTHSLGGILLRLWLSQNALPRLGRVVMLGPPNKGSELSDVFGLLPGFRRIAGPAGAQLGAGPLSVPNALGPVDFDLGVIAGNRGANPISAALLARPNDGAVTVESTRIAGMRDHIVLPTTHTFMMSNPLVIAQAIAFLREGRFERGLKLGQAVRRALRA